MVKHALKMNVSPETAIYLNGERIHSISAEAAFLQSAFLWGDSLFTTFNLEEGKSLFFEDHWERLEQAFQFQWNKRFETLKWQELFKKVSQNHNGNFRVRLTFYYELNEELQGLFLFQPLCEGVSKLSLSLRPLPILAKERSSIVKTGQYGDTIRVLNQAKAEGFQEVLFENDGFLHECTFGNIFLFKENQVFTPSLKKGMLEGVTRRHFLNFLKEKRFEIFENEIAIEECKRMDALFVTNSSKGLCAVEKLDNLKFNANEAMIESWNRWCEQYRTKI